MPELTAPQYERARPIFDRARRRFHPFVGLDSVETDGREVRLRLSTRDGPAVDVHITFPATDAIRFRWAYGRAPARRTTEMLVDDPVTLRVRVEETQERVVIAAGGPPLVLDRLPWRMSFGAFSTHPADSSLVEWVAEPGGYALEHDRTLAYETWRLSPGEQLFGLGERFHGPRLLGHRLSHWIDEPFGTNTADRVHKSIPLVVSSRGYGLFFHHPEELTFDLGAGSNASASVLAECDELDLFVMLGSPKDVLRTYTALTGRPPIPPDWSFGVWMSKCMYASRTEVEDVLDTAANLGLDIDVVNLDPLWLADRPGRGHDFCDFVWNERDFGPMDDFVAMLRGRGVHLCLWVNPHVDDDSDSFLPERMVDGARDRIFPERGYVDLTGGGAEWWEDELTRLVDAGVEVFKLDYGETLPSDARMADGRTGAVVHNLYPLLASIVAARSGAALHYTRAGTAGSQRYPLHWSGDAQSSWHGMYGALRGGLSAAWSGLAHWTTDIGGFYLRDLHHATDPDLGFRQTEPELFTRWMQFGMLCSHTRFHGKGPREPWVFGDEAVGVARRYTDLRRRMRGYLLDCAREAADTGCPVMRPLALEFPDDPGAREIDTSYMLGPGLYVRPVLESGGEDVDVYLPPGTWTEHFTGEVAEGPGWTTVCVPLDRAPLYVRDGYKPIADG